MSPSRDPQNARAQRPSEGQLEQRLAELYQSAPQRHNAPRFEEQWRIAQRRAEAPSQRSPLEWAPVGKWSLALSAVALASALLSLAQPTPQTKPVAHGAGEPLPSAPPNDALEADEEVFAWGDGWLEGDEWSLEWPQDTRGPQRHELSEDREG